MLSVRGASLSANCGEEETVKRHLVGSAFESLEAGRRVGGEHHARSRVLWLRARRRCQREVHEEQAARCSAKVKKGRGPYTSSQ